MLDFEVHMLILMSYATFFSLKMRQITNYTILCIKLTLDNFLFISRHKLSLNTKIDVDTDGDHDSDDNAIIIVITQKIC